MDREKARTILGEGATEEQITNLLNSWHIDENEKVQELQNQINSLTAENSKHSDYDEIKSQLDEINKAKLTEQEKLELMKKETEQNLRNSRIIVNTAKAKEILAGLNLEDDIISLVVSDDADKTIASANKLKARFDITKEMAAKETKESLATLDLNPGITNVNQNDNAMTLAKFGTMSAEEQEKWLAENPNGLENLN